MTIPTLAEVADWYERLREGDYVASRNPRNYLWRVAYIAPDAALLQAVTPRIHTNDYFGYGKDASWFRHMIPRADIYMPRADIYMPRGHIYDGWEGTNKSDGMRKLRMAIVPPTPAKWFAFLGEDGLDEAMSAGKVWVEKLL